MSLMFILEIVLWIGLVWFGLKAVLATILQIKANFFPSEIAFERFRELMGYTWKRQWFYTACVFVPLALINGWLVWDLF